MTTTLSALRREQRETELGLEIKCACCKEFWPADKEFFYFTKGVPHSWCKACYLSNEKVLEKAGRSKNAQRDKRAAAKRAAAQPILLQANPSCICGAPLPSCAPA